MVGIILVTHGSFGKELLKSTQMIMGDIENIKTLGLYPSEKPEQLREEVEQEIKNMDTGDGVLVLVDLLGGSPCNVTAACIRLENVECVTGLSMPMLIRALEAREYTPLEELPQLCIECAKECAVNVKEHYLS